jgi:multidrug efflux system membrane fusion protein
MDFGPVSSYGEPFLAGKERGAGRLTDHVGATGMRSRGQMAYILSTATGDEVRMRIAMARLALVMSVVAPLLAGCGESQQPTRAAPPPPTVTVSKPVTRTVVDQDEYVGRFVAVDSVEIRARVSGYLDSVNFTDGQTVKKGDLLFTIDRRPYQTALDQARANLTQARANLAFTEADLARAQQLVRDRTITEQTFDQRTQAKRVAEASVGANEALVRQGELDISFTELRAPVDGRIGDRRVSPGNLVTGGTGGNTTLLATIVSIDPIRFEFTFDEASYLRYERFAKHGNAGDPVVATPVKLKLIGEQGFDHDGQIDFIDNAISQSSGTIRGRAVFQNPSALFTPGMFGRIQVPGSEPYEALLIVDEALGTEQARKFVFVVDPENIARQKYVTLGQIHDGLRVIKDGLSADDRVVVSGLTMVRPGTKVVPQEAPPPRTPVSKAE